RDNCHLVLKILHKFPLRFSPNRHPRLNSIGYKLNLYGAAFVAIGRLEGKVAVITGGANATGQTIYPNGGMYVG
ncbi:MAG: hypothetical protein ACI96M_004398, partial [Candidatus Azotimanducaceae bacterium]